MNKNYIFLALSIIFFGGCMNDPLNFTDSDPLEVQIKEGVFPDFSFAGYEKSEKPIPLVPVKITLSPGNKNDRIAIQNAIDSLSILPDKGSFRGAILLKKGEYFVDNTLYIRKSGIVIRGEGQGENGTVLHSTNTAEEWASPQLISYPTTETMNRFAFIKFNGGTAKGGTGNVQSFTKDIEVGQKQIYVGDASDFSIGDLVLMIKTTNEEWISYTKTADYGWTPDSYQLQHRSRIMGIDYKNNIITIEDPAVDNFYLAEGGGTIETVTYPDRINRVGLENLRLIATTDGPTPEHHTWTAVEFSGVVNGWVRNMTALHFSFAAVEIKGNSDYNTIQDCAMLEPVSENTAPRRYHFHLTSGKGNLFQRLYSDSGRHDFATSSRISGPNVFLDGLAVNTSNDIGPHHRWASGTLYDNISGGRLAARNNGTNGGGHGWAGVQTLFWNSHASQSFVVENPPNAINWCVGCTGEGLSGNGYWASKGQYVSPRSLFIYQLDQRIGHSKADEIIAPVQRGEKNIWKELQNWAGSGDALVKPHFN